ncbi:hypothetical protein DL96DRAFT_1627164 [Flagelloscypha sp. PMI_526]|nr:hypothetical protein DL96DRAFT_1627164 [Flagelloscypha sp. PMI_526]
MSDPWLPPELERKVFELTAVAYPETFSTLLFVCRRVKEWLDQARFHELCITFKGPIYDEESLRLLASKEPAFLQAHVKALKVGCTGDHGPLNDWKLVLASCTQVSKLTLCDKMPFEWASPTIREVKKSAIFSMAEFFITEFPDIQFLTLDSRMSSAFGKKMLSFPNPLNSLTHLCCNLALLGHTWIARTGTQYLPSLTHILSTDSNGYTPDLRAFFESAPQLVLLAIVARPGTVFVHHPKLVVICLKKPQEVVQRLISGTSRWSESDLWQRAEKIMEERKRENS